MPVSQLESLPNEILKDIIEKYINSVDIINAFAFQLNRRFDALIIQSQRLRFSFSGWNRTQVRCIYQASIGRRLSSGMKIEFFPLYSLI